MFGFLCNFLLPAFRPECVDIREIENELSGDHVHLLKQRGVISYNKAIVLQSLLENASHKDRGNETADQRQQRRLLSHV